MSRDNSATIDDFEWRDALDVVDRLAQMQRTAPAAERTIAADELEQLVREVEQAAAELRAQELSSADAPASPYKRSRRPLWLLIGALWIGTALVTGGALVALALLLR